MTLAYLGLGSNIGDKVQYILEARAALRAQHTIKEQQYSGLYYTSSVGDTTQPAYLNCVVVINTTLSATQLLAILQKIECDLGRVRYAHNQNAARTIDIDIIFFGTQRVDTEHLVIPHPRYTQRLFVLLPLLGLLSETTPVKHSEIVAILQSPSSVPFFRTQDVVKIS